MPLPQQTTREIKSSAPLAFSSAYCLGTQVKFPHEVFST